MYHLLSKYSNVHHLVIFDANQLEKTLLDLLKGYTRFYLIGSHQHVHTTIPDHWDEVGIPSDISSMNSDEVSLPLRTLTINAFGSPLVKSFCVNSSLPRAILRNIIKVDTIGCIANSHNLMSPGVQVQYLIELLRLTPNLQSLTTGVLSSHFAMVSWTSNRTDHLRNDRNPIFHLQSITEKTCSDSTMLKAHWGDWGSLISSLVLFITSSFAHLDKVAICGVPFPISCLSRIGMIPLKCLDLTGCCLVTDYQVASIFSPANSICNSVECVSLEGTAVGYMTLESLLLHCSNMTLLNFNYILTPLWEDQAVPSILYGPVFDHAAPFRGSIIDSTVGNGTGDQVKNTISYIPIDSFLLKSRLYSHRQGRKLPSHRTLKYLRIAGSQTLTNQAISSILVMLPLVEFLDMSFCPNLSSDLGNKLENYQQFSHVVPVSKQYQIESLEVKPRQNRISLVQNVPRRKGFKRIRSASNMRSLSSNLRAVTSNLTVTMIPDDSDNITLLSSYDGPIYGLHLKRILIVGSPIQEQVLRRTLYTIRRHYRRFDAFYDSTNAISIIYQLTKYAVDETIFWKQFVQCDKL
eukprot:GHVH01000194.1.p1 GENE.GHVH01000194.1~~GHVH01000194.1.p1  ORF type:complete len:672 (+),score=33.97 GHVH01000194.1:286-2016(+)